MRFGAKYAAGVAVAAFTLPFNALAQDSSASPAPAAPQTATSSADAAGGVEDIVVTAQFRSQKLQDTPLAITAVTGAALDARSASSVVDLASSAPSVEIRSGGSVYGPAPQIYIRGIGQQDSSYAAEPGVGLYIDDVYYGSALGSVVDLLDLDRVEILRGPQGTLAGKNSVGGAIKLFSKRPTGDGSGFVELGYGSFNRIDVRASLDVPIIDDTLALRVSGVSKRRNGYLTRLDFGCANPGSGVAPTVTDTGCKIGTEGGLNYQAGRAALRWTPNDRLEVNVIGTVAVDNSEIGATKLLASSVNTNVPAGFDQSQFLTGAHSRTNYGNYSSGAFTDPAQYASAPGAGYHEAIQVEPESRSRSYIGSASIEYELNDDLSLTSITAYQDIHGNYGKDIDLTPFGVNTINYSFEHKQFTQELRLNAHMFDIVDLTLGGFYYHANSGFGGIQVNAPGTARENIYLLDDRIRNRSKSVFAHAVVAVTDRLNLTGGIRYTDDSKSYLFVRRNPFQQDLPAYTAGGKIDGVEGHYNGDRVDYRVNVDYRWSDELLTYAQVSTGYKGGGVNPRPYVAEQAVPFGPEKVITYEAGFKSDLFDRMLRLNGAAFINKYSDIIFTNQTPTPNSTLNATPVNAGDATFKGIELEAMLRPAQGLQIDLSGSYLHFKLDSIGASGATISGITLDSQAPNAPKWKLSAGAQYAIETDNIGTITPRLDIAYQSSMYAEITNDPIAKTEGRTVLNGRISWTSPDREWEAALSVTNLTNKFYYYTKQKYPIGSSVGLVAPPREWKISLRRNF